MSGISNLSERSQQNGEFHSIKAYCLYAILCAIFQVVHMAPNRTKCFI